MTWVILFPPFAAAVFLAVALWLDERDLRVTYALFGTTGFVDVDARFRREEADVLDFTKLREVK